MAYPNPYGPPAAGPPPNPGYQYPQPPQQQPQYPSYPQPYVPHPYGQPPQPPASYQPQRPAAAPDCTYRDFIEALCKAINCHQSTAMALFRELLEAGDIQCDMQNDGSPVTMIHQSSKNMWEEYGRGGSRGRILGRR